MSSNRTSDTHRTITRGSDDKCATTVSPELTGDELSKVSGGAIDSFIWFISYQPTTK